MLEFTNTFKDAKLDIGIQPMPRRLEKFTRYLSNDILRAELQWTNPKLLSFEGYKEMKKAKKEVELHRRCFPTAKVGAWVSEDHPLTRENDKVY